MYKYRTLYEGKIHFYWGKILCDIAVSLVTSFCSVLSFQGCLFSKQPWKQDLPLGRRQMYLLTRKVKIISVSAERVSWGWWSSLKDESFTKLGFLSFDMNPLCALHPSMPPWGLQSKENASEPEASEACCAISTNVLCL